MGNVWRLAFLGTTFFWLMMVLVVTLIPAHAGEAGSLTIHVENLSLNGGVLRLGLYNEAGYPDDDAAPIASADVAVSPGENVIILHGIAPGTYAIETFQDVNANGKMDTTWFGFPLEPFGFPLEPFGFSRDARPHFSKPRFRNVSFPVVAGDNEQTLHLQNSISLIAQKDENVAGF
jgi:uncharacterized protein (DUF2141 family)